MKTMSHMGMSPNSGGKRAVVKLTYMDKFYMRMRKNIENV